MDAVVDAATLDEGTVSPPTADEIDDSGADVEVEVSDGEGVAEETTRAAGEVATTPASDAELDGMTAEEEGVTTDELVLTRAFVAELDDATTGVVDELATALDDETVVAPVLAQAKLILVTRAPEDFGALKSQVMSTYGQQTLSAPTLAMSPLTKTVVEVTAAPDFAPVLSTSWNDVPA